MVNNINSVFVNNFACAGWIIQFLADDVYNGVKNMGIECRMGLFEEYNGEDLAFHMTWRSAVPYKKAKRNSVFITHVDDVLLEKDLLSLKGKFDSYITMSTEDAEFLKQLGFEDNKVFGATLPVRNTYIKPYSIGIFSKCYSDHRKNENWLYEYCQYRKEASLINFVFLGTGWGGFCDKLSELGVSTVWYNISRSLPSEYMYQQLELSKLDCYIYMGMDGGAMGTYDAYAMGLDLCVTDDGFHKEIPDVDYLFETKEQFFKCLDSIVDKQVRRLDFFEKRSRSNYVDRLWRIWNGEILEEESTDKSSESVFPSVVEKRRHNYSFLYPPRIKRHLLPFIFKYLNNLKYKRRE